MGKNTTKAKAKAKPAEEGSEDEVEIRVTDLHKLHAQYIDEEFGFEVDPTAVALIYKTRVPFRQSDMYATFRDTETDDEPKPAKKKKAKAAPADDGDDSDDEPDEVAAKRQAKAGKVKAKRKASTDESDTAARPAKSIKAKAKRKAAEAAPY